MLLSLPDPRESSRSRRFPLTPPSVTPPSVSVSGSSTMQSERDRCTSPSQTATTLLAKVATPQPQTGTTPSSPRMAMSNSSSASSTPLSTPPGDGCHFPFGSMQKGLPESPDGGYISFPVFEEFGGYKSEDEAGSPPPHKRWLGSLQLEDPEDNHGNWRILGELYKIGRLFSVTAHRQFFKIQLWAEDGNQSKRKKNL